MGQTLGNNRYDHDEGVNAAFMRNHLGAVCIAFPDTAWVRSDAILIDRDSGAVHAVIHESCHLIGHVSQAMAESFAGQDEVLLTAIRPDGTIFELTAPMQTGRA